MLSLFECLSRRTVQTLSTIRSVSYQRQCQDFYGLTESKRFESNNDKNEEKFDEKSGQYKHESNSNDNGKQFNAFNECKYNLLNCKLLETVGWLGAAVVVGLNFENRFFTKSKISQNYCYKTSSNCTSICGGCEHCKSLFSKLLVFARPVKHERYVLSKTQVEHNVYKKGESSDGCLAQVNDPIDEICKQMKNASIDYIEQLNNMLGIALIENEPKRAMQCWSDCKNSSKALFNMGVAFETGKHNGKGSPDLMQAYQHYTLSASMGHKYAIYNLSLFYLKGKGGVQVDLNKATALLERAAKLGVKEAQNFCDQLKKQNEELNCSAKKGMRSSASAPNLSIMSNPAINLIISDKFGAEYRSPTNRMVEKVL